jgi:SulP family sulfate permease
VFLTLRGTTDLNAYVLAVSSGTIAVIVVMRRVSRAIPGPLVALAIAAVCAAAFELEPSGVALVGAMPSNLPPLVIPGFSLVGLRELFTGAVAISVVGLVEAIAIAKSIAMRSEQRIAPNREFVGQGLANLAGSFLCCFPASGSFTRSAVNFDARAQTRLAGALSGVLVGAALLFFAAYARFIPRASLAGVIVLVAYSMVDQHAIGKIARANRHDLTVMLITMAATVVMPDLERAIITGIAVSILVHLWNTGEIRVRQLRQTGERSFRELDLAKGLPPENRSEVPIIHIEGDLFFGSAADLHDKLQQVTSAFDAPLFILRLKRVNAVDISAFEVLETFVEKAIANGKTILLCGVSPEMKRFLDRVGITAMVGAENVFPAGEHIYESSSLACTRARLLLDQRAAPVPHLAAAREPSAVGSGGGQDAR